VNIQSNKENGKTKRSKVATESVYLGSAQSIVDKFKTSTKPIEARHRDFGFVAAVYQTAVTIGLVDLLKDHIPGQRFGTPRWLYFMLPIINRLQQATSKQRIGRWTKGTILPDLLDFDPAKLNSKTFWYVTDDVISERELRERREENPELDDELFVGLDDAVFVQIENKLTEKLKESFGLFAHTLLYDTGQHRT